MTDEEWQACVKPEPMLAFLRGRTSDRKLRLFACGCGRRMWDVLTARTDRAAIKLGERWADGEPVGDAVESLRREIDWRTPGAAKYAVYPYADGAANFAQAAATQALAERTWTAAVRRALNEEGETADEAYKAGQRAYFSSVGRALSDERAAHARLLRCVFNPFRPVAVDPTWLTSTVTALASAIYARRAFECLPILADALMDAGCEHDDLLAHLRGDGPHARGCWALDLLLGKE